MRTCLALAALSLPIAAQDPDRKLLESAEQIMREVEELRGWKFKHPVKKDVRTVDELRAFLERKFDEAYGDHKLERTESWMKALSLLPPDGGLRQTFMDVMLSQIGGFYDPDEKAFYMMADSSRFGEFVGRMLVAHELCHALDDQYVDLGRMIGRSARDLTQDQGFALGSVVEGSATALMFAWMAARRDQVDVQKMLELQKSEMERAKPLIEAPRYFSLIAANYLVGRSFITRGAGVMSVVDAGGADTGGAILDVAKNLPRSSEQVLHPEKYWDEAERDEPVVVANDDAVAARLAAVSSMHVVMRETLGELVMALCGMRPDKKVNMGLMASPDYWTNKYSRGWGGDRLYLLVGRTDDGGDDLAAPGVVWITAWDTVGDREEFVEGMQKFRGDGPGFVLRESGRVAVFGFGKGGAAEVEAALGLARFEQDGASWSAEPK